MAKLSPIDKIDIVLSIFQPNEYILEVGETKKTIQRKLLNEKMINIDERLLDEILFKLDKDQYIKGEYGGSIQRNGQLYIADPKIYKLTFEGELFIISGGYKQAVFNLSQNEKRIKRNDKMLAWGTVFAAIGTTGLLLWEIDKEYFHLLEKLYNYLFGSG